MNIDKQLERIKRGSVDLINKEELKAKLAKGKPLRVKLGMDPTAPDIHLGHSVVLNKMRQFQDLGHKAVLIIGDYTALVGDPSGANKTRPMLSKDDIEKNAKTYFDQAGKILDTSKEKLEIRYNSEWLKKLSFAEVIKLTSIMTVARMLERDTFELRYKAGVPIGTHEFLYPLMQGYDSLMIDADVELGGTDQTFNNLVGRDVQKSHGKEQQIVLTMPLLVGLDGTEKMSKSKGNYIGVAESAQEIFGKMLSISDELMWNYYELLSGKSLDEIAQLKNDVDKGTVHPKAAKVGLAKEIVEKFHSKKAADDAEAEFEKVFSKKGLPTDIEEVKVKVEVKVEKVPVVELLLDLKMVASKGEARRLIQQGGVSIDDTKVADINSNIACSGSHIIKVGKRKFKKVVY